MRKRQLKKNMKKSIDKILASGQLNGFFAETEWVAQKAGVSFEELAAVGQMLSRRPVGTIVFRESLAIFPEIPEDLSEIPTRTVHVKKTTTPGVSTSFWENEK
jgi:hypothetical protein